MHRSGVWWALSVAVALGQGASASDRKTVSSIEDLPRHTYPVQGDVLAFLTQTPAAFQASAAPVRADVDHVLATYDVSDHATLRDMLRARLAIEMASGRDDASALLTIDAILAADDKAQARLTGQLTEQAFLRARLVTHDAPGVCPAGFAALYAGALSPLPWTVVGAELKNQKGFTQIVTPTFLSGLVGAELQPTLDHEHALTDKPMWSLLAARTRLDVSVPCRAQIVAALTAYIRQHDVAKADIWAARTVTLPSSAKLTPVTVAIWDSGFEGALFPRQLLTGDGGDPVAGPAYDVDYKPTTGELIPLTASQTAAYPGLVADVQSISDLEGGIDSPGAAAFRAKVAALPAPRMQALVEQVRVATAYMHGTHVAGIAALGNPAIRLVSARLTYDSRPVPAPPTDEMMRRNVKMYADEAAWFRTHGVRVVNMSWWNRPSSYEDDLAKNGLGGTVEERRRLARRYFNIERDALYAAIKGSPDILFVTIAGNNNANNVFEETIPSSFQLPNLLVVGAVDQAGERTPFTSTGQNIGVYADGLEVESTVPGGARVKMSGTSMAAPEVTNLAAKILAVRPELSPPQLIEAIEKNSEAGSEPTIRLIDPRRTMATLCGSECRQGAQ